MHHAKDVEELKLIRPGLRGKLASSLEVVTGKHALRSAVAVLGVTDEIRAYQLETRAVRKKSWVYPNGVVSSEIPLLEDKRDAVTIEAAFICGHFSPWHGLDLLTEELRRASVLRVIPSGLKIHLIGKLSESQIRDVEMANVNQEVFIIHGNLSPSEYVPILTRCDVGIGSLAMFRENLTQGATLKVREYLALGLPVYSGHVDTSIPKTFKYYKCGSISLPQVIDFANSLKAAKRNEVREASAQYIEKLQLMRSVVDWLSGN
ncbi:MAG: hypothetical protein EOP38_05120 [Rubrivivax sp.]|nr:MAG: hypothetical protein EOP38_05120 [Rubrivivax sp.]